MTDTIRLTGQCLCGQTKIIATQAHTHVGACHCGMCRRWGGGPLLAIDCGSAVEFEGAENITVYDSSDWAERGFCKHCGSHLFYHLKQADQYIVPVGLFDDQKVFVLDHQVFIDRKPEYYAFANQTETMTEAEVFAKYGGG